MFLTRAVRRRVAEARHLGEPVHPIRWALEELAAEWHTLTDTLGGPR